ncbi:MAG: hypothetical protein LBB94_12040 [Clostridiales bacterium]|jgi:uncharacterized repeat protein (TIGR02543 family)|nr:hypothetical protein [Clostridiales bacterium]
MFSNRKAMAAVTAISLAVLIVTGTFAWTSLNSQKVNEWFGAGVNPETVAGGTLHDDHEQNGDSKQVYVENWGAENLYVRIRLSEYMELGQGAGLKAAEGAAYNPQNSAVPLIDGAIIEDPDTWKPHVPAEADAAVCDTEFHNYWIWEMGGKKSYNTAPPDKRTDKEYVHSQSNLDPNEVVKETLTAQVLTMAQWISNGSQIGSVWVIDTDGWAYWAAPLYPGEATGLLLNKVVKDKTPEKDYYYGINVHAQMATKDGATTNGELDNYKSFGLNGNWTDDGKQLMELIVAYAAPPAEPGNNTHNFTLAFGTGGAIMPFYAYVNAHEAGTEISLKERVRVLPGYDFDKWISSDDNVVFSNPNSTASTFIMPDNDVAITATFKMNPNHPQYNNTYKFTLAFGTGGTIMPFYAYVNEHEAGAKISLRSRVRILPGYDFDKWISSDDNVVFSNPNNLESTFIMPNNDVTITAAFKMNPNHPSYPGND